MLSKKEKFARLKDDRRRLVDLVDSLLQDVYSQRSVYECQLENAILLIDTAIGDAQIAGIDFSSVTR